MPITTPPDSSDNQSTAPTPRNKGTLHRLAARAPSMAPAAEFRVGQRVAQVEDTSAQRAPATARAPSRRPAGAPPPPVGLATSRGGTPPAGAPPPLASVDLTPSRGSTTSPGSPSQQDPSLAAGAPLPSVGLAPARAGSPPESSSQHDPSNAAGATAGAAIGGKGGTALSAPAAAAPAAAAPAAAAARGTGTESPQFAPLQRGTVRYVGPVAGQRGVWVGVEWDDARRGKHSGEAGGSKYFECEQEGAGSFVRPPKVTPGVPLPQALAERYGSAGLAFKEVPMYWLRKKGAMTLELKTKPPPPEHKESTQSEASGAPLGDQPPAQTAVSTTDIPPPDSAPSQSSHPSSPSAPPPPPSPALSAKPVDSGPPPSPSAHPSTAAALPRLRGAAGYVPPEDTVGSAGPRGVLRSCAAGMRELVLPDSLLSDWADVESILEELPSLGVLDLSGAHLRIPPPPLTPSEPTPPAATPPAPAQRVPTPPPLAATAPPASAQSVLRADAGDSAPLQPKAPQVLSTALHTLALNRCRLDWGQVQWVCQRLPSLSSLVLSHNRISSLAPTLPSLLRSLTLLDLGSNGLTRWDTLLPLGSLPALQILRLARNDIATIPPETLSPPCASDPVPGQTSGEVPILFPCLREMDLRHNEIADWASVSALDVLPALERLLILHNPISQPSSEGRGNAHEFIARLGGLTSLNGSRVSADERRNSELAYLNGLLAGCGSAGTGYQEAVAAHPRLPALLKKYDVDFFEEVKLASEKNKSKGPSARGQFLVVRAALMGDGGRGEGRGLTTGASKKLPASTTVRQLRALVPHLLKLKRPADRSFVLFLADEGGGGSSPVHLLYSDTETLSWYADVQSPVIILKALKEGTSDAMTRREITALEEEVRLALLDAQRP